MTTHIAATKADRTLEKALARFKQGRLDDARAMCTTILKRNPDEPRALHLLGVVHLKGGHGEAAAATLARAAQADPGNAEIHNNHATALRWLGRLDEALAAGRRAVAIDPGFSAAHLGLGLSHEANGEEEKAVAFFEAALRGDPGIVEARRHLAEILRRSGRLAEALAHYGVLAAALPDDNEIRNAHAVVLAALGRGKEAEAALRAIIARDPGAAEAHCNLGNLLCDRHAVLEAIDHLERASAGDPGCTDTLANLGHALRQAGRVEDAIARYEQALILDPDHLEAGFGCAVGNLLLGRYARGWAHYLARDSMSGAPAHLTRSPLPADLGQRTVLLVPDQGLGDEIFLLRFAHRLRARGARVVLKPDPRLVAMLRRAGIADEVLGPDDPAEAPDLTISVGDLPYVLETADDDPVPDIYAIPPLPEALDRARAVLAAAGPGPYLGVTWRAGTRGRLHRLYKEIPITRLARAVSASGATVVSLQRDPAPGETEAFAAALGRPVHDASALNGDLEAMLALASLLDDYACVSNTNVHLRAATGRTTRVLIPNPPEFRWMANGTESPWFPGSRVYRQDAAGSWQAALVALAADLDPRQKA